ncbi:MAG: MbnP family protein [Ferruginibacter sp.]
MKRILLLSSIAIMSLCSCKKDDNPEYNPNVKADLSVEFDNIAGADDLQLNTGIYTNADGESFSVSKLKYYVSNFKLTKTDGSEYIVPQESCYFLIDEADEDTHEPVLSIPEGEYSSISFLLGVDSLRSTLDISQRTGVLDTSIITDMHWDQNSGYIFFNMEGNAVASSTGNFMYHIGGYGGAVSATINNIKTITLDLTARGTPKVKSGKETNIHLMVDVLKVFTGSANVSIAANSTVMFDLFSASIANNYSSMIRHDHTEN